MDANLTLNVLVCQRAIDLCYSAAWPENTSIDLLPCTGWVAVCARFDASELVRLLLRLADAPMAPADVSHRLNSAAAKLRNTDATAVVYPGRERYPARCCRRPHPSAARYCWRAGKSMRRSHPGRYRAFLSGAPGIFAWWWWSATRRNGWAPPNRKTLNGHCERRGAVLRAEAGYRR